MTTKGSKYYYYYPNPGSGGAIDYSLYLPPVGPFANLGLQLISAQSSQTVGGVISFPPGSRSSPVQKNLYTVNNGSLVESQDGNFALFLWCNVLTLGNHVTVTSSGLGGDEAVDPAGPGGPGGNGGSGGAQGSDIGQPNGFNGGTGDNGQGVDAIGLGYGNSYAGSTADFNYGNGGDGSDGDAAAGDGGFGGSRGNGFGGGGGGGSSEISAGAGGGGGGGLIVIVGNELVRSAGTPAFAADGGDGGFNSVDGNSGGVGGGGVIWMAFRKKSSALFTTSVQPGSGSILDGGPGTVSIFAIDKSNNLIAKTISDTWDFSLP